MRLNEMYDKAEPGYQDTGADNSKIKWKQSRNTKLILRQIRKLRKMLDVRNFEHANNLKKIRKQYTPASSEAGGMPGL